MKNIYTYKINPNDKCFNCKNCIITKKWLIFAERECLIGRINPLMLDILVCKDFINKSE